MLGGEICRGVRGYVAIEVREKGLVFCCSRRWMWADTAYVEDVKSRADGVSSSMIGGVATGWSTLWCSWTDEGGNPRCVCWARSLLGRGWKMVIFILSDAHRRSQAAAVPHTSQW